MGPREAWLLRDRALEVGLSRQVILPVEPVQMLQAEMIERPGLKVVRCHQAREVGLVQRDLDLESGDDAGDDTGVDLVNVVEPPCEALAPEDAARARVGQFDRDRDRRSEHLDDPGQAVADVQDPSRLRPDRTRCRGSERTSLGR